MKKKVILKANCQITGEPEQQLEDVFMVVRKDKEDGKLAITFVGKPEDAIETVETIASLAMRMILNEEGSAECLLQEMKLFKCDIRDALESGLRDGFNRAFEDLARELVKRGLYEQASDFINVFNANDIKE